MENVSRLFILPVLFASLLLFGCLGDGGSNTNSGSGDGRVVFAGKDAAADMGSVTSVRTTIDSIQVHSQAQGWVTVSSTPRTIDLMQLRANGDAELLADARIANGTYDQMDLHISQVIVTDARGSSEAKMPSNSIKIKGNLVVVANTTSSATIDFLADESLHMSAEGKYVMAPVIKAETRTDADVQVTSSNKVLVSGGNVVTDVKVGMDLNGNVGVGLFVPPNANLTVASNGKITIMTAGTILASGSGRAVFGIADPAAKMGTVTQVNVTIDSVRAHSATQGWVDVSTKQQTVDLLELNASGRIMALADVNLTAGTYDQLRLEISKVLITDADGTHEAKLPSGELKIKGDLVVRANATASAVFDFAANESLHLTGNGKYIMAPVVHLQTRSDADVSTVGSSTIRITGGNVRTSIKVGMDADGNVGINLWIPANANVTIQANGDVVIVGGTDANSNLVITGSTRVGASN